jgi:D-alanine-D-alanine ligase-like ATP-grasp enzyme
VAERLEMLGCICVGSGAPAQRLAQDKLGTARAVAAVGVMTPTSFHPDEWPDDVAHAVLKLRRGACQRGVQIVSRSDRDRLPSSIGAEWLLQRYIEGPEYTVAVLEDPEREGPFVFPPLRIRFHGSEVPVSVMAEHTIGRSATSERHRRVTFEAVATKVFQCLGLRDYARLDFRLGSTGPVLLDANAMPSLNPVQGLFATAAAEAGISYHSLIWKLADRALSRCGT